jgi:hypothetical protein
MKSRTVRWHPGGGSWRPVNEKPPQRDWLSSGRERRTANRSLTAREAAHRLFGTPLDPKDDTKPPPTPGQVMDKLLKDARNENRINTTKDPLQ